MSNKKRTNLANPRSVQRLARAHNIPECLMQPGTAHLLPLYLRVEQLSLDRGYCYAGDQSLADHFGIVKTTIVRQRNKLERLGVIIREGRAGTRKLFPWWQWAARQAQAGNMQAVNALLHRVVNRPYQADMFADDAPIEGGQHIAPSVKAIEEHIAQAYPARSFFALPEQEQVRYTQGGLWQLGSVADLAWLFDQAITPKAYRLYRMLQAEQRVQVQEHAPQYAWANRDNADYMMDLSRYLNPDEPGYLKRVRSRNKAAAGRSGMTAAQAAFVGNQVQVDTDFFN